MIKKEKLSPMMQHYENMKQQYSDCVLFYRLGDFYELFNEDAIEISRVLDLTLTSKSCGMEEKAPMCGVPYHAAESYIAKLVSLGYKVAICEQLTDPKPGQIVERDVIKVITAGTVTEDSMLDEHKNNYIMCLYLNDNNLSVVYSDITTGEFHLQNFKDLSKFADLFTMIMPSQVIGNKDGKTFYNNLPIQNTGNCPKFEEYYEYAFVLDKCKDSIFNQFGENALNVFEIKNKNDIISVGALVEYLCETQKRSLKNINKIIKHTNDNFMVIDMNTRRNLELVESIRERKKYGSLLWLLDKTKTAMGARLLSGMIVSPLCSANEINYRLDGVQELFDSTVVRVGVSDMLRQVKDIERLTGKIAGGSIMPVDCLALAQSLLTVPNLNFQLTGFGSAILKDISRGLRDMTELAQYILSVIAENPPATNPATC